MKIDTPKEMPTHLLADPDFLYHQGRQIFKKNQFG